MLENKENSRVLNRLGARELSAEEYNNVGGGIIIITRPCTFDARTCNMDGDCEPIRCP